MNTTYPYIPGYDAWKLASPDEPSPCRDCPRRNAHGTDAWLLNTEIGGEGGAE